MSRVIDPSQTITEFLRNVVSLPLTTIRLRWATFRTRILFKANERGAPNPFSISEFLEMWKKLDVTLCRFQYLRELGITLLVGAGTEVVLDNLDQDNFTVPVKEEHVREYVRERIPRIAAREGIILNFALRMENVE